MDLHADTYLPWFTLRELPGIGNRLCKHLIRRFGSPQTLFSAPPSALHDIQDITDDALASLARYREYTGTAERELYQIRERGLSVLVYTDPLYPALLKEIPDPPMILVYDGKLQKDQPCFSIVGSRKATRYGRDTARYLAAGLARKGFSIVSGMAAGIDTAAHQGAMETSGKTLAVMGAGFNHIYPRQNRGLYREITQNGAVLSEFRLDDPPLAGHFPVRNRIIAGLSCGTLVVEAAQRSGSLITARLAGEFNREVFAVPGSIASPQSRGTHLLIRQGAILVENEADILEELTHFVHAEPSRSPEPESRPESKKTEPVMDKDMALVYNHLDPYPRHADDIIEAVSLDSSRVLTALTRMELAGIIHRHPGNLFSLSKE